MTSKGEKGLLGNLGQAAQRCMAEARVCQLLPTRRPTSPPRRSVQGLGQARILVLCKIVSMRNSRILPGDHAPLAWMYSLGCKRVDMVSTLIIPNEYAPA